MVKHESNHDHQCTSLYPNIPLLDPELATITAFPQVYSKEELPVTDSTRDNEEALYLLHSNGYKVESALEGAYKHMAHISSLGTTKLVFTFIKPI